MLFITTLNPFQLMEAGRPRMNPGCQRSPCCKKSEHFFYPFKPFLAFILLSFFNSFYDIERHFHRDCESCKMNEDCNKKVTFNVDLKRFVNSVMWFLVC